MVEIIDRIWRKSNRHWLGLPRLRQAEVLGCAAVAGAVIAAAEPEPALRLSVYATAGDVARYLAPESERPLTLEILRQTGVTRVFLEGRRGDESVAPAALAEIRDFLRAHGIAAAGGIATVPGDRFGVRQNEALGWLNWESERTRRDVAAFFRDNATVFDELIVDDFFCTADTSEVSQQARGGRSWGEYRRDLLVSLIEPLIVEPARALRPDVRLILKFPQWYDRFHGFGYDPPRMARPFDRIWVGTEVRNPQTRRMGFVQPTEGYVNFRWLKSVIGDKVHGAWFDHIECSAQNFLDQAFLSVLAGARELTLFNLSDLRQGHPGDPLLAAHWTTLQRLAETLHGQPVTGIAAYKPAGSDADDNLYLFDYLAMIGLPLVPESQYPASERVALLPAQAAADPNIIDRMRSHLRTGATLIVTPAFVRRIGQPAETLSGVEVAPTSQPAAATTAGVGRRPVTLEQPLDLDAGVAVRTARVRLTARAGDHHLPWLTEQRHARGRVLMLNVRTFSEEDFRAAGEWLLAPRRLGLPRLPQEMLDPLRKALLRPLGLTFRAPPGVFLLCAGGRPILYNFNDLPVLVEWGGRRLELGAHALREP